MAKFLWCSPEPRSERQRPTVSRARRTWIYSSFRQRQWMPSICNSKMQSPQIQIPSFRWWTKGRNMHECIHAFHHPKPNAISDNPVKPICCRMSSQISQMFGKASTALRIRKNTHTPKWNSFHRNAWGMVGALLACGLRTIARSCAVDNVNSCLDWILAKWCEYLVGRD